MIYKRSKEKILSLLGEKLAGRIKTNEVLSLHTTFRIGGPADFYYEAGTTEDLIEAMRVAKKLDIPFLILGGGSNLLVGDKGFRGLVIKNKSREIKILGYKGIVETQKSRLRQGFGGQAKVKNVLLEVDAGVHFNQLVRFTIEEGLSGLEEFLGLPGTVGGAIAGNAHWKDKRIEDFLVSKKTYNGILLSVVFRLRKEEKEILWSRARKAMEYRRTTQPLVFPSAGCIFKNIKKSEAARIGTPNLTTSAGFLIEAVGLKGTKIGQIQISPLHANFMINLSSDLNGGKAADVLKLIDLVKKKVEQKFGVKLILEIKKIGEF